MGERMGCNELPENALDPAEGMGPANAAAHVPPAPLQGALEALLHSRYAGKGPDFTESDVRLFFSALPCKLFEGLVAFDETGVVFYANAAACRVLRRTRTELLSEAGQPLNTTARVEPNRHVASEQDSIIRLEYNGMTVQLRVPGPGGELFEQVAVTDRKWLNFPYFRPGVSAEKVIQAMGEPQRREANRLIYNCGAGEADEPVVFEISEGTVERIVFNYYVD